ncbi:hypothetical protein CISIN_1g0469252mg, partial [Citrus sinensis]
MEIAKLINHISHQHPLILFDEEEGYWNCTMCYENIHECDYNAHACCVVPKAQQEYDIRDEHFLTLIRNIDDVYVCCGREKSIQGPTPAYGCGLCGFYLHKSWLVTNLVTMTSLTAKLYFVPKCVATGRNFVSCNTPILHCVKCNFNVHLMCSSLPQTIVHANHHHSLTLMDSIVEDGYPDELYFDVCKKQRDPQECICYCCVACCFMVEFNCVISE